MKIFCTLKYIDIMYKYIFVQDTSLLRTTVGGSKYNSRVEECILKGRDLLAGREVDVGVFSYSQEVIALACLRKTAFLLRNR